MRTPTSDPWIIALSMRLYQWILYLGPAAYRNEYAQATLQVFCQCCHDAYQQRRTPGVLALWLPMFSEAIAGMLAERLSTHERIAPMLPTMRRSIIVTFSSFAFFGVAYLFLMRITDGDPQLDAAANAHLNIRLAFAAINWSAQIAFLIIVLGGSPLLFIAIKQAIVRRHSNPLALFAIRPKLMLTLVALTILIEVGFFAFIIVAQAIASAPSKPVNLAVIQPPLVALQLGIVTLFTFVLVAGTLLPSLAILRSDFGMRILHYALILIGLTTITMAISLIATISWIISMWINAPQIADNLGLGPAGLRGNIGGSEGVMIVVAMMALAAALTAVALKRGLHSRTLVLA